MTFSKSIQKRIEAQAGEKLFTQAEVDALVAAAVALVVQHAVATAQRTPFRPHAENDRDYHSGCEQTRERIVEALVKLVPNPNALAEHDAALREAEAEKHHERWRQSVLLLKGNTAKLEAENAGLRDRFHKAMKRAGVQGLMIARVFTMLDGAAGPEGRK